MNKVFDIMDVPEEWRNKLSEYIAENFSIKVIDCIADPYDKMENGDYHSSILIDLDRFAKMIVRECCSISDEVERADTGTFASKFIRARFGIEE